MNVLDQVNDVVKSRPWENRLVALACSESYQLSPSGAQCMFVIPPNWGKGRKAWDTNAVAGNPAYGRPLKPRCTASGELTVEPNSLRSSALLRLSPRAERASGV